MIKDGIGGANTQTGIEFEKESDLLDFLDKKVLDYSVKRGDVGYEIYFKEDLVACSFKKHDLYAYLAVRKVDWKKHLTKKLLPDDAIYVIANNTVNILEIKYQEGDGSVDEKLQTCDFKRKQYIKLFSELNYEVEYIYVLNDWFKQEKYKDVLDYIISVDCTYYFNYVPFQKIGLPISTYHS